MISINDIRKKPQGTLLLGNHPGMVQAILDFDYACGKKEPSVVGCITSNRKAQKFFFGSKEILIPCWNSIAAVPASYKTKVQWFLNAQSGRRAFDSTVAFFEAFPNAHGGHLFAENIPEIHSTELIKRFGDKVIAGPSGVGILVPGSLKVGAIGGIGVAQLSQGHLATPGSVAVVSTSGGMTNELITAVSLANQRVSFSLSIGGDRFPVTSLGDVLALAEGDSATKAVVYFGELGGVDEYEIVELIKAQKLTKPVIAYVAGVIDEAFDEHMQFGHAKALVARKDESARAKRDALRSAGAQAPDTFPQFLEEIARLNTPAFRPLRSRSGETGDTVIPVNDLTARKSSILSTREILDLDDVPVFVKNKKVVPQKSGFTTAILNALLEKPVSSPVTIAFAEAIFTSLIDHGGHVSGAVNTMVTARAGKDLVSSLAAGILTIGPRFGGAVNEAAAQWVAGVSDGADAHTFVEKRTKGGKLLSGVGHRKYRVGIPDPRVASLSQFADLLKKHPHYDFARAVEKVTTGKNGNLILNVDGVMAALFLDIMSECENYSTLELQELIDVEFFNALFVIPRSVGFIAHFIEQKKNDEGLFRLPDELLFERKKK